MSECKVVSTKKNSLACLCIVYRESRSLECIFYVYALSAEIINETSECTIAFELHSISDLGQ